MKRVHLLSERFLPPPRERLEYEFHTFYLETLFQNSTLTTPVVSDGDPVGGWSDRLGNARHLIQATGSARPVYRSSYINGRPAVVGDGVGTWLRRTSLPDLAQPLTIYCVFRWDSVVGSTQTVYDSGHTASGNQVQVRSSSDTRLIASAGSSVIWPELGSPIGIGPHVTGVAYDGAASTFMIGKSVVRDNASMGTQRLPGLTLLANRNVSATGWMPGGVGSLMVYSARHSIPQMQRITRWLERRYGLI
jgi:hypothetical protein